MQRVALVADIAEEKLPHSARLIQSGGLFNGKKSWHHVIAFRGESAAHRNANMEMPAVAES